MVSPDSLGTACPLSGRNSTYRPVQISETSSLAASDITTLYNSGNGLGYGIGGTATTYAVVPEDFNYVYDLVGNITSLTNRANTGTAATTTLAYDPLNRLTSASSAAASNSYSQIYAYNPLGDITNKSDVGAYTYSTSTYANPHAPTTVNGTTYSYDNNGNLTSASPWGYAWDYRNRLINATSTSASSTYAYDYQNNRVFQLTASSTTYYPSKYYSITSTTTAGTTYATSTDYVYAGDDLVAEINQKLINGSASGTPSTYYVHSDNLGSIVALTDASGTPQQALDFYPYGSSRIASSTSGVDSKRKYIGQFYDASGLSYLNSRYYNGAQGQFLSEDPVFLGNFSQQTLKDPQSLNSYSYSVNNPITKSDPSGENYLLAAVAAYDAVVIRDFGEDVVGNFQNPNVPWYEKLAPQDPNAALRYNEDAYGGALAAMAYVATEGQLAPYVSSGALSISGANVVKATVAGLSGVAYSYARGDLTNDSSMTAGQKAIATFEAGFFGARVSQQIPGPVGAVPSTLYSSLASAHAVAEQYRAQADQATQALFARLFPQTSASQAQGSSKSSSEGSKAAHLTP